jgi:hypothetical protein
MSIKKLAPNLPRCRDPENRGVGHCSRSKSGLGLCGRGACRRRARIHLALGELRQHRVSLLLLLKSLMQRLLVVPQIELTRQRRGRAVGRNLIMLKLLRRRDQGGVAEFVSFDDLRHLPRFMRERLHGLVGMLRFGAVSR